MSSNSPFLGNLAILLLAGLLRLQLLKTHRIESAAPPQLYAYYCKNYLLLDITLRGTELGSAASRGGASPLS